MIKTKRCLAIGIVLLVSGQVVPVLEAHLRLWLDLPSNSLSEIVTAFQWAYVLIVMDLLYQKTSFNFSSDCRHTRCGGQQAESRNEVSLNGSSAAGLIGETEHRTVFQLSSPTRAAERCVSRFACPPLFEAAGPEPRVKRIA